MAGSRSKTRSGLGGRPDLATLAGLLLAVGGILGGLVLEKGELRDVAQPTAALIVLGGTIGATLVGTPLSVFLAALRRLAGVFFERTANPQSLLDELMDFAGKARKNGLVSLEAETEQIEDPFLRKALTLAVDGVDIEEVRKMMELDISVYESRVESEAKVFESAGGFAPTIGIIGAVLGLIQVMKDLDDTHKVGEGIAVAFVATIYGVGVANLLFLPAGAKIRARLQHEIQLKEVIVEGVVGIVEGLNPKLIRSKLEAYVSGGASRKRREPGRPRVERAETSAAAAGD